MLVYTSGIATMTSVRGVQVKMICAGEAKKAEDAIVGGKGKGCWESEAKNNIL